MAHAITIPRGDERTFIIYGMELATSLRRSVQLLVGRNATEVTATTAKEIFTHLRSKASILAFITKPIVFIPLSITFFVVGLIPIISAIIAVEALEATVLTTIVYVALRVSAVVFISIAAWVLQFSIENTWNGFLSNVSTAYALKRDEAEACLLQLRNRAPQDRVRLDFASTRV